MKNLHVLVLKTATLGGANYLIDRFYQWLIKNGIFAQQAIISEGIWPDNKNWDLLIAPSYAIYDAYTLKLHGYKIYNMILWVMGMGCFQDGYYNPMHVRGIKGFINKILQKEAENTLHMLKKGHGICFTDTVGRYHTFREKINCDDNYENYDLIPIAVNIPSMCLTQRHEILKVCWLGRVDFDFKFIPLKDILINFETYVKHNDARIEFTIVGSGTAVESVKELVKTFSYKVEMIEYIEYEQLDSFFRQQDLTFAMGTSALDAARNGCATVVVTPVRPNIDSPNVKYRWIFESKGYSLGEYPGLDVTTGQIRKDFVQIMNEYLQDMSLDEKCYRYTQEYDEDHVFKKLLNGELAIPIDRKMWIHIRRYYWIKKMLKMYSKVIDLLQLKNFRI